MSPMHEQTDPLHLQIDDDRTDLFKTILETAHDAVIALDQNHNIMFFNHGAKRIFGYEDAEIMGTSLEILLPVSMREVYRTLMGGLAESAVTSRAVGERREVSGRRKDGTSFPAEIDMARAPAGEKTIFTVVIRDITERKQAKERIQQKMNNLERAEQSARLGSWEWQVGGTSGHWSKQMFRMFGFEPADSPPDFEAYLERIHPEDRLYVLEALEQMAKGQEPTQRDYRSNPDYGPIRVFSPTWQCERDVEGKPTRYWGTLVDVTERLSEADAFNQYLRKLTAQAPGAIYEFRLSPDGVMSFPFMSEGIADIHPGLTAESVMGDASLGFTKMHPDDVPIVQASIAASAEALTNWDVEFRVIIEDGSIRWHRGNAKPERAPDGTVIWYGTFQDITEMKRSEALITLQKERAEALARTAGRLNSYLDLQSVLHAVCEETARALHVPAVFISLIDEVRQTVTIAADYGLPEIYRQQARPMPLASYAALEQHSQGQLLVIDDMQGIPGLPEAELVRQADIRSMAVKAMKQGEQLIGALGIVSIGETRRFDDDELALLKVLADQAAQAIANARLYADAQRRLKRLQGMHAVDQAIANTFDLKMTARLLVEKTAGELGVDAVGLLLLNPLTLTLEPIAGRGFRTPAVQNGRVRLGRGISGRTALERKAVLITDLPERLKEFTRANLLADEGFVSYAGAPLLAKGQIKGVLEVFHRAPLSPDHEWLEFFDALAGQAAIAIDSAQAFEGLQRANINLSLAYDATIEGWSRAMDLRDKETEGHTQRVTELTLRLARASGISEAEVVHIRRGALLHDMGKLGIPDSILLKPGKLTDEEWALMRKHPQLAYEMLSSIEYLRPALDIPYCHHEKWDGTGYPQGLKGAAIPRAARLFAVVDVWDALRSDRPYRTAMSVEEVLEHIRSLSGTHFDPEAVELFLRVMEADTPGGSNLLD